jgi:hypothetical protein
MTVLIRNCLDWRHPCSGSASAHAAHSRRLQSAAGRLAGSRWKGSDNLPQLLEVNTTSGQAFAIAEHNFCTPDPPGR